ncbi:MAG: XrtA system polysaccharide deacetylase, partial [Chloroflexota bacterium]
MINAFTVDLEDWYHGLTSTNRRPALWPGLESRVVSNTERLLDILAEHDVRATFFVLGEVAGQYPDLVRRVAAEGHEISVHGHAHADIRTLTPKRFGSELDQALAVLTPLATQPIVGHRAPYFSIDESTLWSLDVLAERGFTYDSSMFPTRNMLYGYPGAPRFPHRLDGSNGLVEFPASTARFLRINWPIAGGFYVRTLPYSIIRWGIRSLNRQGQPAIMYVHPWELDLDQPMRAASLRERITHYSGRRSLESKLRQLLQEFEFGPLREMVDQVDRAPPSGLRLHKSPDPSEVRVSLDSLSSDPSNRGDGHSVQRSGGDGRFSRPTDGHLLQNIRDHPLPRRLTGRAGETLIRLRIGESKLRSVGARIRGLTGLVNEELVSHISRGAAKTYAAVKEWFAQSVFVPLTGHLQSVRGAAESGMASVRSTIAGIRAQDVRQWVAQSVYAPLAQQLERVPGAVETGIASVRSTIAGIRVQDVRQW